MEEKAWQEVLERLARIETKLDNYELLREKADKAYSMAWHNEEAIREIKSNNKWAWGYMIALGLGVVSYFLTKGIGG
ncbi:hemolysin XhlA family protein [Lactococcus petauri]|uniref:hemolysin XhlA family protein n=1 Tax=Lactococcus petauri TaxID=1940789 RepID=UPI001BD18401|nr:hemolysin XhlA family protein [Lactococcus petauri]MBS4460915.1 hemolysin XhlA family protein [Lactococcus petauri]